jgi:SNF2 family DNA or RNA helicase
MDYKQYQYEGVEWCVLNELRLHPPHNVRGGFIADEMGLGKTITMIGTMICNRVRKTLIIVPPVLLSQWNMQIYKTTKYKSIVYYGEEKKHITRETIDAKPTVIVLATYASLNSSLLQSIEWDRVIFDEAHHLKNSQTKIFGFASLLRAKIRWLVSGTPIQNRASEFRNLCTILKLPKEAKKELSFHANFILKRTKSQVNIIIPDKHISTQLIEWGNKEEKTLSENIHSTLSFNRQPDSTLKASISMLMRARQICIYPKLVKKHETLPLYNNEIQCSSKLDAVVKSITEKKNNGCGKLVFCYFHEEMDCILTRLRENNVGSVVAIDGRLSSSVRNELLSQKHDVIILQIQTCSEGLNLQDNYNEIYFVSAHWNPFVEDQAIARCHRIGQTKPVYVYRYEMGNIKTNMQTVEKYIMDTQEKKRQMVDEIFDA